MRNIYKTISVFFTLLLFQQTLTAQCGSSVAGGSSSNMFTQIRNATNPVAADKNLNTIVFIHRNDVGSYGGSSGNLRYDVSTNGGTTWTNNLGVLNPINSSFGRYPNVAIYNPTLNTNPSNAYLGFMAATINSATSAWNGCVTGVRQLNGAGNTENYNQPVVNPQLIPHSIVKGAPGTFWSIDALFNGSYITGFTIYKGVWNGSNDISWSNNFSVTPPFNTVYSGIPQVGDYNIAFDPTGTIGYFSFLSHLSPGPSNYAYYPILYKTTNGGASWTGPIQVDLNQFTCLTSNLTSPNVITTNFEHDLTVDVNGNPHLFTTICNGTNAYSVLYSAWHHMYDITLKNGLWVAYDVANVNAGRGTWGVSPNAASMDMAPQISRTLDGTKLFFTWSDNSIYSLGTANLSPDLFSRAYNVSADTWTGIKNFSSCNIATSGKIIFPHMAPEVLEPSANNYKLASVYGEYAVAGDPLQTSNFYFLDNETYAAAEFTTATPPATVAIQQGNNLLFCPNSTLIINVAGSPGQVVWSTGATTNTLAITNSTNNVYTATAQVGCNVGSASITVTDLTFTATSLAAGVCPGNTIGLSVVGNATNYIWTPGALSGSNVVVTASTNPIYTVTGSGSSCNSTQTLAITIFPLPNLSVSGNNTICIGDALTQTVSGAVTYSWSNNVLGSVLTATPNMNTTYTVTGIDANTCVNSTTTQVFVNPLPTVTAVSNQPSVCAGASVSLGATGAVSYSWNAVAGNSIFVTNPTITTIYTVTGIDLNSCINSKTVSVIAVPLPSITIASTKTIICKGEKNILTVGGASSYTWALTPVSSQTAILVSPTITTTYSISGKSVEGCLNTANFTLAVSECIGFNSIADNDSELRVYPNPSNGEITVKSEISIDLNLVDELGRVVRTFSLSDSNKHQVNVSDLANGIYFIVGKNDLVKVNQKIVVAK